MRSFFLLALFVITSLSVDAATTLKLVSGEYAPYSGEKIDQQGLSTLIVSAVFKEMKQDFKIEFMPWNRAMNNMKSAAYAGSFPWKINDDRKKDMLFSEPIHQYQIMLFMRKGASFEPEALTQKNLCYPSGWDYVPYGPLVEKYKMTAIRPINIESCVQMLALGRVDLIFMNEHVGQYTLKQLFGTNSPIIGMATPLFNKPSTLFFIVPKNYPNAEKIMNDFNVGLEKIKKNGVYDGLVNGYSM